MFTGTLNSPPKSSGQNETAVASTDNQKKKRRSSASINLRASLLAATASFIGKMKRSTDSESEVPAAVDLLATASTDKPPSRSAKSTSAPKPVVHQCQKPPTKPVSPKFTLKQRSKEDNPLNSEQRALQMLDDERRKREQVMQKTKSYYERLMKSHQKDKEKKKTSIDAVASKRRGSAVCSVARAAGLGRRKSLGSGKGGTALPVSATKARRLLQREKKLQQQRMASLSTPRAAGQSMSRLAHTASPRILSARSAARVTGGRSVQKKEHNTKAQTPKLTIVQPFSLQTDKRFAQAPKSETKGLTAGELVQQFVRDTRTHEVCFFT